MAIQRYFQVSEGIGFDRLELDFMGLEDINGPRIHEWQSAVCASFIVKIRYAVQLGAQLSPRSFLCPSLVMRGLAASHGLRLLSVACTCN